MLKDPFCWHNDNPPDNLCPRNYPTNPVSSAQLLFKMHPLTSDMASFDLSPTLSIQSRAEKAQIGNCSPKSSSVRSFFLQHQVQLQARSWPICEGPAWGLRNLDLAASCVTKCAD